MENAKLDYKEIFVLKSLRKNGKTKAQGIKYLDRPYPAIKPARTVLFNLSGSRFCLLTDKNVFVFDNFTKQNIFKVSLEGTEPLKVMFFCNDLVALCPDGVYFFREHTDEANFKFTRHLRKLELEEDHLFDIDNVNDTHIVLTATNNTHVIRVVTASGSGKVQTEVKYMISLGGSKKLKYLHKRTDLPSLYPPELENEQSELMMFLDYTDPSSLRYLILNGEFRLLVEFHAVNIRPAESTHSDQDYEGGEHDSATERELDEGRTVPGSKPPHSHGVSSAMDVENTDLKQTLESVKQVEVKNIDSLIPVPRTNQVVIVDLTNGVFTVDLNPKMPHTPAVLQPFWELEQFEKIKFRCACLCFDKNRHPLLCMFTLRQTHQHLQFRSLSKSAPKTEYGCEITESKVKAKKIFFNPLWNAFMILDFDESYYLMEFYYLNYYEKYYIRFKAIDDNQVYVEDETEFDLKSPITFKSTAASESDLFEAINGRPTDHPMLQPYLDISQYKTNEEV